MGHYRFIVLWLCFSHPGLPLNPPSHSPTLALFFTKEPATMPRPSSDIWQYFTIVPSETKVKKAKCNFCGHEQSSGVTRLANHLTEKCQSLPPELRTELRSKTDLNKTKSGHDSGGLEDALAILDGSSHMSSGSSHNNFAASSLATQRFHVAPARMDPQDQSTIDRCLARAFFASGISFAAVEHPLVIDVLRRLRPEYVVPRKRRLQQLLLKTEHWDLVEYEIQKPDFIAENGGGEKNGPAGVEGGGQVQGGGTSSSGAGSNNVVYMYSAGL
ncbi:hypothetical protein BC936DRAFT_138578 [Jimgerdemannia flammicorona]|uniref:BED-type domain-containing protein n=1 Tax=Jimgerdemannia flammicorona TaxID=994334 RepID=A0A433C2R0_9FUNG|nr:hypothetical protein BC936DRAFT_138578 [Jimgerdemannia flammicorona]